jgi:peptide/nickel transport system permease protein
MPPMIALIAMDIAFVIGGAYQVEVIFNYPGIGYRTISAINSLDFPILQFIVVIGGVAVVIANFIADLLLIYIDPRIKIS